MQAFKRFIVLPNGNYYKASTSAAKSSRVGNCRLSHKSQGEGIRFERLSEGRRGAIRFSEDHHLQSAMIDRVSLVCSRIPAWGGGCERHVSVFEHRVVNALFA
jgi:hypothetical protein